MKRKKLKVKTNKKKYSFRHFWHHHNHSHCRHHHYHQQQHHHHHHYFTQEEGLGAAILGIFMFFFSTWTGWGKTSLPNISDFSNILQEVKMPIVDYATCAAGNAKLTYAKVDDEIEVCSGYGGNNPVSVYLFIFLSFSFFLSFFPSLFIYLVI